MPKKLSRCYLGISEVAQLKWALGNPCCLPYSDGSSGTPGVKEPFPKAGIISRATVNGV